MARKFNQQEKEHIQNKLLQTGRNLFNNLGLKKTSISDLTKHAGIAQGTFYLFFPSKEALYFTILEQEETRIREELFTQQLAHEKLTKVAFKQFLKDALNMLDESPLLRQLFDATTMEQLLRKLPQEQLENNKKGDIQFLVPFIEKWQAEGSLKPYAPDIIVSMVRSLIILSLQKEVIGEKQYHATMDQLIMFIVDGLVVE